MDAPTRQSLGQLLVAHGALTEAQVQQVLATPSPDGRRERLGATVIRLGLASEGDIADALAAQLGLDRAGSADLRADASVASTLDHDVALEELALPLRDDEGTLVVAMADPTDVVLLDELRLRTGARRIRRVVATPTDLTGAIERAYGDGGSTRAIVDELDVDVAPVDDELDDLADPTRPMVRLANQILVDALRLRASDVHVEATREGARVRVRIDGILKEVTRLPRSARGPLVSRLKIMGKMDIAERRLPQDGRAMLRIDGQEVDVRMAAMPTMHGETVVLRLLRRQHDAGGVDTLQLEPHLQEVYQRALEQPQGMVLVTGPTGSGKTSTLYAGLTTITTVESNIITLEDPVEYELAGVNQTQVHPRIGLTFAAGMRNVLRQDPDVVMVGEVRDGETAALAVEAAMTGHLVLSTLHTNDAVATLSRLEELDVDRRLLAAALQLVVSQRLVRVLCPACAVDGLPEDRAMSRAGMVPADLRGLRTRRAVGCAECAETGYRGRTLAAEVLPITPELRDRIADGAPASGLRAIARSNGMRSLREDGLRLAVAGTTTVEEVVRVTPEDPDWTGGELVGRLRAEVSGTPATPAPAHV